MLKFYSYYRKNNCIKNFILLCKCTQRKEVLKRDQSILIFKTIYVVKLKTLFAIPAETGLLYGPYSRKC